MNLIKPKAPHILSAVVLIFSMISTNVVFAKTSSSSQVPTYLTQWGSQGSGNGQFNNPVGIAINQSSGNIYVADHTNYRIQEFTGSGSYITQWGSQGTGNGQFNNPLYMDINQSTGNVYVVDGQNDNVQEFTSSGTYITQWGSQGTGNGQFSNPIGIAINQSSGNVYVSDGQNFNIQEFTGSGSYITQWGSQGSGNGQFNQAVGIAINQSSGNVYVSDANNYNVQEFTDSGTYITQWGSQGNGNSQFNNPIDIAIDQLTGNIYIMDDGNYRVQEFTDSGTYITQWGSQGSGNDQFSNPFGIDIDQSSGSIYVDDVDNDNVQEFGLPQNLAQETAPNTTDQANLSLPNGSNITSESIEKATTADGNYNLPLGLLNFTFTTAGNIAGAAVPIQITFQTSLTPSEVIPVKYNSNSKTYTDIPGATVTQTNVGGKPALLVNYSVTDGGPLDQDGIVNGVVVDPVGLATNSSIPAAPNTGLGLRHNNVGTSLLIYSFIITSLLMLFMYVKKLRV